jgi:hypothetical protein
VGQESALHCGQVSALYYKASLRALLLSKFPRSNPGQLYPLYYEASDRNLQWARFRALLWCKCPLSYVALASVLYCEQVFAFHCEASVCALQ